MKQRQISDYNIKKGFQEINETEYLEKFHAIAEKKWESLSCDPPAKAKQKFINYLQYRGWESSLIFEKLKDFSK